MQRLSLATRPCRFYRRSAVAATAATTSASPSPAFGYISVSGLLWLAPPVARPAATRVLTSGCSGAAAAWLIFGVWLGVHRFRIVKRRLQRSLGGLSSCLLRLLFAALQALAHPFAHVWLVTHPQPRGQRMPSQAYQACQRTFLDWVGLKHSAVEKLGLGLPTAPERTDLLATRTSTVPLPYNVAMPIPPEIQGQKYISLPRSARGAAVPTPVWFGEKDDKLYVMTRSDSGKYKRIRNNPQVRVAPCTMRGKITGPEFAATARILPPEDWPRARKTIKEVLAGANFVLLEQEERLSGDRRLAVGRCFLALQQLQRPLR